MRHLAVLAALAAALAPAGAQTTWYVDASATQMADGSAAKPFQTIQEGVDHAADGDVVSVASGDYHENVVMPNKGIRVESQGGPLVTTLRALNAGAAFHSTFKLAGSTGAECMIVGFTVRDSDIGISTSTDEYVRAERCIVTGNGVGTHGNDLWLDDCTVVGNDVGVKEKGYGLVARNSILWGNATWDYLNQSISSFGVFHCVVGMGKVHDTVGGSAGIPPTDPQLWGPPGLPFFLRPTSPCIDLCGPDDVGALEFDPTFGHDVQDVGGGLAGGAGTPTLDAEGYMFTGETIVLRVQQGPANGIALFVIGASALSVPFLGGTLVPNPDVVTPGVPLTALGTATASALWPPNVPAGTSTWVQAWLPDPNGPQGYAATNGLKLTAP